MTTEIVSWNIQAAKGVDGVTSSKRIADDIKAFADADVICLQEVLRTVDDDQVHDIAGFFPDHEMYFGSAINRAHPSGRLEFGNMILTRLTVLQAAHHKLPEPSEPEAKNMPRQAIELILQYNNEPLRVVTTHLEYFAIQQRTAQVHYLAQHHMECMQRFIHPPPSGGTEQFESIPETALSIYAGDFNLTVDSDDYKHLTSDTEVSALEDCWRLIHGEKPHDPTCGIFDHVQWEEGSHCRDFFFASADMSARVSDMVVQMETAASDHQPIKIVVD